MAGARETRNALAVALGTWYAKRLLRRRAAAVLTGVAAGKGFSRTGHTRSHRPWRWLLLLGACAAGGLLWWRRRPGGGDDGGGGGLPADPPPPEPAEPVPAPRRAPEPELVST